MFITVYMCCISCVLWCNMILCNILCDILYFIRSAVSCLMLLCFFLLFLSFFYPFLSSRWCDFLELGSRVVTVGIRALGWVNTWALDWCLSWESVLVIFIYNYIFIYLPYLLDYLFGFSNISFEVDGVVVCVCNTTTTDERGSICLRVEVFVETVDLIPSLVRFVVWSKDFIWSLKETC